MALSSACALVGRHILYRNAFKCFDNSGRAAIYSSPKYSTTPTISAEDVASIFHDTEGKQNQKLSKAMKAHLQRATKYSEFMKKERSEYQIGKRHLANMMGEDPENFTQDDVNKAIEYLFPSGLYDRKARPIMEEPEKIFPRHRAAAFDESGRPFHSMFYTIKPNYYEALYNIVEQMEKLDKIEDTQLSRGLLPKDTDKMRMSGYEWVSQNRLATICFENIRDKDYSNFITAIQRLAEHPYSEKAKDFISQYMILGLEKTTKLIIPPLEYDTEGRPYVFIKGCRRKNAWASVKILGNGTGKITINGQDISYFPRLQHREQVSYVCCQPRMHEVSDKMELQKLFSIRETESFHSDDSLLNSQAV